MPEAAQPVQQAPSQAAVSFAPPPKGRFELPALANDPPAQAKGTPQAELPLAQTDSQPSQAQAESGEPAQNKGEQAPPAESDGETETQQAQQQEKELTPEQAAKREGRRFERRLDKAYRKAAEAQARAELLERQLNEIRSAPQQQAQVTASAQPGVPTLEAFGYDEEKYRTAVTEHAKAQAIREYEQRKQVETAQQYRQRIVSGWEEKAESVASKYEDFDQLVGEMQPTNHLTAAIMEADNGPEIAYYLAKNIKEAQRIVALPPMSQLREIGKLEAKLAAQPEKPKAPSKAPPPIAPLTGSSNVVTDTPSESDDYKTWLAKRNKQLGRRTHGL